MPETHEGFGLPPHTVTALQTVLQRHQAVMRADVYGSRAKGTQRPGSDIDLTLFGAELTPDECLAIDREIDELDLPYRVDLSIYALIEDPALRAHIDRVGRPIHQRRGSAR